MKKIKYLISIIALIALIIGCYWAIITFSFNKESFFRNIQQEVKNITGYDSVAGNIDISVFPIPVITISDFKINNAHDATTSYFFQAKKINITLDLTSIFSEKKKAKRIDVKNPLLELQYLSDKKTNWGFINNLKGNNLSFIDNNIIHFINGKINYSKRSNAAYNEFSNINIDITDDSSEEIKIKGKFDFAQQNIIINTKILFNKYNDLSDFSSQIDFNLTQSDSYINYIGEISHNSDGAKINGKIKADFSDAQPLIRYLTNRSTNLNKKLDNPFPLKLSTNIKTTNKRSYILNDISMKVAGANLVGVGEIENKKRPYLNLKIKGDSLNIGQYNLSNKAIDEIQNDMWEILSSNIDISLNAELESIKLKKHRSGKVVFQATVEDHEMVINQAAINLPGDSQFLTFGIMRPEKDKKVQFDGWAELVGKRFDLFSNAFSSKEKISFADHKGSFKSKASVFISSGQTIISGLKFKAGNLSLTGGINMIEGDNQSIQTSLHISGLKTDSIIKTLFSNKNDKRTDKDFKRSFSSYNRKIPWLDNVTKTSIFEVVLDNFTFKNIKGKPSAVKLTISPKELKADNLKIKLGDVSINGSLKFTQKEELPKISGRLNISRFKMSTFIGKHLRRFPVARGNKQVVWSEKLFNFSFLKGYNADLKIHIGKFKHNDFEIKNLSADIHSKLGNWKINDIRGNIWNGRVNASTILDVSSIPEIKGSFSFKNILANHLIKAFASQDNFKGKLSFNGQFNSSGLSLISWISNLSGSFLLYGKDIAIKGFDLSGLVKSIPSVRSISDVINVVRISLLRRKTSFSVIDGTFFIKNGVFHTTNMKLHSRHAIGTAVGSIDLVSWMMNINTIFKLVTISNKEQPTLGISFTDSADDPVAQIDTRSLEAFIARRKL